VSDLVLPLATLGRADVARVGGKAASLGRMLSAGLPVPDGFCVTCAAYRAHLEAHGLETRIAERLGSVDEADPGAIALAAAEIRAWIEGIDPPPAVAEAIAAAYRGIGHGPVAVRSSTPAEDPAGARFAGQHDSYLDVTGETAVLDRVRACWASLWSERAVRNRRQREPRQEPVAIACVVQRMVRATAAGAVLTADPVTGDRDRVLVNAAGEAGALEQFVIRKRDGTVLQRTLRPTRVFQAEPYLPGLLSLALRVGEHFGSPQEIEWAVGANARGTHQTYLLQSEPIAGLSPEPTAFAGGRRPLLASLLRGREPLRLPGALAAWLGILSVSALGAWQVLQYSLGPSLGLRLQAEGESRVLPPLLSGRVPRSGPPAELRFAGYWRVARGGPHVLTLVANGYALVRLDGVDVVERRADARARAVARRAEISAGIHLIEVRYRTEGIRLLRVLEAREGGPPRALDRLDLFPDRPTAAELRARVLVRGLKWVTTVLACSAALTFLVLAWEHRAAWGPRLRLAARYTPAVAATLVVLYGGALRFEALVTRYWEAQGAPGWALDARDAVASLRPRYFEWEQNKNPYDGDPFGYLRFAREPRGLYDAHVREPVFVLAAKLGLWLSGGQDIGLNFASAGFGTLLLAATFLLGARVASPWAGVAAATALAIEQHAVRLSVEGWRDDAFAALATLGVWAVVGLWRAPTRREAVLCGVFGAAACLTRITGLSLLVPGWACIVLFGRGDIRARLRAVFLSMGVFALLVGPYLTTCAIAFGDPLVSVNYHTGFYRGRVGLDARASMGWSEFLLYGRGPLELLDTMRAGLTSVPFGNKWEGFDPWSFRLGPVLAVAAVAGLLAWLTGAEGVLLLVLLGGVVMPFSTTWDVLGGNEWRFTLAAYPLYLVAGCGLLAATADLAAAPRRWRASWPLVARRAALAAALGLGALGLANGLRYERVAEDLQSGKASRIEAGPLDALFLTRGWSWPASNGNMWLRRSRGRLATIELPLAANGDRAVDLRLDARPPSASTTVFLNGTRLAELTGSGDPERLGLHRVVLPAALIRPGRNRIDLQAGPAETILFWYLRVDGTDPSRGPGNGSD